MVAAITEGIKVIVETFFQPKHSNPRVSQYLFAYKITIQNNSEQTIKLLRRRWHIIDSSGKKSEVEGEGVVGLQPILEPHQSHQYVSYCNLESEAGKMYGDYLMERLMDNKLFYVRIPEFSMLVPYKLN